MSHRLRRCAATFAMVVALLAMQCPPAALAQNCCEPGLQAGCGDAACEACVCELDDFCCTDEWDDICADDAIDFCFEQCLCLPFGSPTPDATAIASETPTSTASPSDTAEPTDSPTPEQTSSATPPAPTTPSPSPSTTASATATDTNTATPDTTTPAPATPTDTATATPGTPPPTLADIDDVGFARGDANCDANLRADDVVATGLGLGGNSQCDNDDCNRDGSLTAADLECTARCLFDTCPTAAVGPTLDSVLPDTSPSLSPGSRVRIQGEDVFPADAVTSVFIGGEFAPVVGEPSAGEILVVMPLLGAGPADVVVTNGELSSQPMQIEVAPSATIGSPDTFDSTMELLEQLLARLAALDLSELHGDEARAVSDALTEQQRKIEAAIADLDTELSLDQRASLDEFFESSGLAEELRATIADVEEFTAGSSATTAGTIAVGEIVRRGSNTLRYAAGGIRVAGLAVGATTLVGVAIGTALVAGAIYSTDPFTPLIFDAEFKRAGVSRPFPSASGTVEIRGARFDSLTTQLEIGLGPGRGRFVRSGTVQEDRFIVSLPSGYGFCGPVTMRLVRTGGFSSNPLITRVEPVLASLSPSPARASEELQLGALGFLGCSGTFSLERAKEDGTTFRDIVRPHANLPSLELIARTPTIGNGVFAASLTVAGLRSPRPDQTLTIDSRYTVDFICPEELAVAPSPRSANACGGDILIDGTLWGGLAPRTMSWRYENDAPDVVSITDASPDLLSIHLRAVKPGDATITAELVSIFRGNPVFARVQGVVRVVDETDPEVQVIGPAGAVEPGSTFEITVEATDNVELRDVELQVTGEAVASFSPTGPQSCSQKETCSHTYSVTVKADDFDDTTITAIATATDAAENTGTTPATFSVLEDDECPVITISEPPDRSAVTPGSTVRVIANVNDGPAGSASGISRIRYRTLGFGARSNVDQTINLPSPRLDTSVDFTFDVKTEAELERSVSRGIVVRIEAEDAAGNTCDPSESFVAGGASGDVQVTLGWYNRNDLDLTVTDPTGETIDFVNRTSDSGGRLDLDANVGCSNAESTTRPIENIAWPQGTAPSGSYTVNVVYAQNCSGTPRATDYILRITVDGNLIVNQAGTISSGFYQETFSR